MGRQGHWNQAGRRSGGDKRTPILIRRTRTSAEAMECPTCGFTNPFQNADRCQPCRLAVWAIRELERRDKQTMNP
jgi:hypothetical protein